MAAFMPFPEHAPPDDGSWVVFVGPGDVFVARWEAAGQIQRANAALGEPNPIAAIVAPYSFERDLRRRTASAPRSSWFGVEIIFDEELDDSCLVLDELGRRAYQHAKQAPRSWGTLQQRIRVARLVLESGPPFPERRSDD